MRQKQRNKRLLASRLLSRTWIKGGIWLSIVLTGLVFAQAVSAGSVSLEWTPALDDPLVKGYEVAVGRTSGQYEVRVPADANGAATNRQTVKGLIDGRRYYFSVRSRNHDSSLFSDYSNEVSTVVPGSGPPTAVFGAEPTSGVAPFQVAFTDQSNGSVDLWSWSFGDGASSSQQDPTHTYTSVGTYTVTLTVTGTDGSATETKTGFISVLEAPPAAPTANFIATNQTSGDTPLSVTFTDTSAGEITSRVWNFGDGRSTTGLTVSHTYDAKGIFDVTLTVTGPGGVDSKTKFGFVIVSSSAGGGTGSGDPNAGLVAAYGFEELDSVEVALDDSGHLNNGTLSGAVRVDEGRFGRGVSFDGGDDWVTVNDAESLDLADGMTLEAWIYPSESMSGWQTVLLKERPNGLAYALYANSDANRPVGSVNLGSDRNLAGEAQIQQNQWTHVAATFDGTTQRLYVNGSEVANQGVSGSITVSDGVLRMGGNASWTNEFFKGRIDEVRVYNRVLTAEEIQVDMVTPIATTEPVTPVAAFAADTRSGEVPLSVEFTDQSTGTIETREWSFGDGATSYDQNPSHTYLVAGSYTVSLTVAGPGGSATEIKKAFVTVTDPAPAAPVARFQGDVTSGIAPLAVSFSDQSSGEISTWLWDLGDGHSSNARNPVHVYGSPGIFAVSLTVTGPGGSATETKDAYVAVNTSPPVADFRTVVSGLDVTFTDESLGAISDWSWDFGDSETSTEQSPTHSYGVSGDYTVTLRVFGPGGQDSISQQISVSSDSGGGSDPGENESALIEVGEIKLDHGWKRVEFVSTFVDPVVIAKALSFNGSHPSVVRIRNVDSTGFDMRIQEWDYLDGWHTTETVGYLVMEKGVHVLPNGALVEAGRLDTDATKAFDKVYFSIRFDTEPAVLAAVTTYDDYEDTVDTRIRRVTRDDFEVGMREQESADQNHKFETISYVAWEPSSGTVEGVTYEVGRTGDQVRDNAFTIPFQTAFEIPPVFVADMQTTDGGDTSNLRWNSKTAYGVDVWVSEEQSKDSEIRHTSEVVGYALFDW